MNEMNESGEVLGQSRLLSTDGRFCRRLLWLGLMGGVVGCMIFVMVFAWIVGGWGVALDTFLRVHDAT